MQDRNGMLKNRLYLYKTHSDFNMSEKIEIRNVCSNTSDHLPIQMSIDFHVVEPVTSKTNSSNRKNSVRIKWHKTDTDYKEGL